MSLKPKDLYPVHFMIFVVFVILLFWASTHKQQHEAENVTEVSSNASD